MQIDSCEDKREALGSAAGGTGLLEEFCDDDLWIELFGLVVTYLCSAFVIGLQTVGDQLADPFGSDVVDLAVEHFLQVCAPLTIRASAAGCGRGAYC